VGFKNKPSDQLLLNLIRIRVPTEMARKNLLGLRLMTATYGAPRRNQAIIRAGVDASPYSKVTFLRCPN